MTKPPLVDPLKPNARVADPGTAHHLDGNNSKKKSRLWPLVIALLIAAALAYFLISMLTADNEVSVIDSDPPFEVTTDPDITDDTAIATDPLPAATVTEPEAQSVVGDGAEVEAATDTEAADVAGDPGVTKQTLTVEILEPTDAPATGAGVGAPVDANAETTMVPLQEPPGTPAN